MKKLSIRDLRYDNYFIYDGNIYQLKCMDNWVIVINEEDDVLLVNVDDIEPIILSEQILIDLGFKQHNEYDYYYIKHNNNELILLESDNGFLLCDMDITCEVMYLNHLQNICYDLIGLELIMK